MKKIVMSLSAVMSFLLTACVANTTGIKEQVSPNDQMKEVSKLRVWIAPKYAEALGKKNDRGTKYEYILVRRKVAHQIKMIRWEELNESY